LAFLVRRRLAFIRGAAALPTPDGAPKVFRSWEKFTGRHDGESEGAVSKMTD
jgi:hypothetical protein